MRRCDLVLASCCFPSDGSWPAGSGLLSTQTCKYSVLDPSLSTMAAPPPVSDASGRPLNHLGFIDTSVKQAVDGSCKMLEAGLNAAVTYTGDSCRPCVEDFQRQTSETARKAGQATKECTRSVLEKVDPKVPRPASSRHVYLRIVIKCHSRMSNYLQGHTPRVDCCLKVDRALTSARTMTVSVRDGLLPYAYLEDNKKRWWLLMTLSRSRRTF